MIEPKYRERFEMIVEYYEVNGLMEKSKSFQELALRSNTSDLEKLIELTEKELNGN